MTLQGIVLIAVCVGLRVPLYVVSDLLVKNLGPIILVFVPHSENDYCLIKGIVKEFIFIPFDIQNNILIFRGEAILFPNSQMSEDLPTRRECCAPTRRRRRRSREFSARKWRP